MSTPHNAASPGDIAKVVLMPGDPLRARFIAEHFLDDVHLFTSVRNMYGYTGSYQGMPVSIMGSGMGVPSMAIYAHELYHDYDVQTIIRVGSTGAIAEGVNVRDVIFAQAACTDSNFPRHYNLDGMLAPIGDFRLICQGVNAAKGLGVTYHVGNVITTDTYYCDTEHYRRWANMGVLCTEMETAGLYCCAMEAHKKAVSILTVSDSILTGEQLSATERETTLTHMIQIALEVALSEYA